MVDKYTEKTISQKTIYDGAVIRVNVETVELPNGKQAMRELVHHRGAVGILAITPANKIVLVSQYRKALDKTILEIPAGKLEEGEKPLESAYRELQEETGYTTSTMQQITKFYTSPGFADELIYLFKAGDLKKGKANLDEDEFVDTVELSLFEVAELTRKGAINDAKTLIAIYYWQTEVLKGRL